MASGVGRVLRIGVIAAAILVTGAFPRPASGAISGTLSGFESAYPAAVPCPLSGNGQLGCQVATFVGYFNTRHRGDSGFWAARVVHPGLPTTKGRYAYIDSGSFTLRTGSGRRITGYFRATASGLEDLGQRLGAICTQTFAVTDRLYISGAANSSPIGTFRARLTHYGPRPSGAGCRVLWATVSGRMTISIPG